MGGRLALDAGSPEPLQANSQPDEEARPNLSSPLVESPRGDEVAPVPDPDEPLVLVVEDAEDAATILFELLRHHGFRVAVARNGAEALVRAHTKRQPDLVLLDLSLPLLDGWSVAKALRNDPNTSAIPIIALTAHAVPAHLERARSAGCDSVFVKPAPHAELLLEIRRRIRRAAQVKRPA